MYGFRACLRWSSDWRAGRSLQGENAYTRITFLTYISCKQSAHMAVIIVLYNLSFPQSCTIHVQCPFKCLASKKLRIQYNNMWGKFYHNYRLFLAIDKIKPKGKTLKVICALLTESNNENLLSFFSLIIVITIIISNYIRKCTCVLYKKLNNWES